MATAATSPSIPGAKGPRMCRAVVDLGGDLMRDALFCHINPTVIMSHVIGSSYFRRYPLNCHQMSILGNVSSKGDYSECDVTLSYSLLRNCGPTNTTLRPTAGWGLPVAAGDIGIGDDLERIRDIRNKMVGHIATTLISDQDYNTCMTELRDICIRMDSVHGFFLASPTPRTQTYTQRLNDIQTISIDSVMEAKYAAELERMAETDRETREMIHEVKEGIQSGLILGSRAHFICIYTDGNVYGTKYSFEI